MAKAYLMLGNVKTLVLSWNELPSVDGLERMYSLERLALDHNRIGYLQDVAGLASLPELMQLEMRGNPIEANGKSAANGWCTP
jgi:dynein light chain 1